jgi:hypothetical protein
MKKMTLHFEELGITMDVDVKKLQEARDNDRRGYATFNATDSENEEVCLAGNKPDIFVPVQLLLNDTSRASKGKKKKVRKVLDAGA